ncbi:MAG TPA: PHP domain-containing protein [Actinomycetota bacterium]|jgi:putative hydrolase|nr:PHP domain-containing protein [Actinomycetota bacterium]
MTHPAPTNAALGELLWRESAQESDHRRRALERAARAARFWPEEAADLARAERSLTELRAVGPWIARRLHEWLEDPPDRIEPEPARRGFLTYAEVRRALDADPGWEALAHGDLQVHSTDSDGALALADMAAAAASLGRTFIASTDHSKSLRIAHGMDEAALERHNREVDRLNASFERAGDGFRILRSIEMDVLEDGSGDMDPASLASLDIVLGAFHTKLRVTDDSTERYLAALRNPTVHVLAHPVARMYGRRVGLTADWPHVFEEAARLGKAVEIDATPARQDLSVELARIAVASGVRWFSIGSDAHDDGELGFLPFGLAIAALAGVPRDRILNYRSADEVRAWARAIDGRD